MIRQDVWHAEAEIFLFAVADGVNTKLFRGWSKPDNFKNVMNEVYNIATNAPEKLKADGRELADDRMTKLLASLQTIAMPGATIKQSRSSRSLRKCCLEIRHIGRWATLTLNP
ncbi:hypothetical protein DPV78_004762 [Talaromyces pinophilus]|nr:hypothetical protein DPV78_004762 [Talaromyces pinophilus]